MIIMNDLAANLDAKLATDQATCKIMSRYGWSMQ